MLRSEDRTFNKHIYALLILLFQVLFIDIVFAFDTNQNSLKYMYENYVYRTDARSTSMGKTAIASTNGSIYSFFINPANLYDVNKEGFTCADNGFAYLFIHKYGLGISRIYSNSFNSDNRHDTSRVISISIPISFRIFEQLNAGISYSYYVRSRVIEYQDYYTWEGWITPNHKHNEITLENYEYKEFGYANIFKYGLTYKPNSKTTLSAIVETPGAMNYSSSSGPVTAEYYYNYPQSEYRDILPNSYGLGINYVLCPPITISNDFIIREWSKVRRIEANNVYIPKLSDTWEEHFGAEYRVSDSFSLRNGIYITQNMQNTNNLQTCLTLGLGYNYKKNFGVDLAVETDRMFSSESKNSERGDLSVFYYLPAKYTYPKSVVMTSLLTIYPGIIFHGVGYMYAGEPKTGWILFGLEVLSLPMIASYPGMVLCAGTWLYDVIGSPSAAIKYNRTHGKGLNEAN